MRDHSRRAYRVRRYFVRWKRLARCTVQRAKVIVRERHRHVPSERWVIVRDRDGRIWAGPYRWRGQTFTEAERFWYMFANIESAMAAVEGHGFVGVTVKQIV